MSSSEIHGQLTATGADAPALLAPKSALISLLISRVTLNPVRTLPRSKAREGGAVRLTRQR